MVFGLSSHLVNGAFRFGLNSLSTKRILQRAKTAQCRQKGHMTRPLEQNQLADEQRIALAYMRGSARDMLAGALALDRRLARIVAHSSEPALAQMRLAWWRDNLSKPVSERASGDQILDALGRHWLGRERALQMLVDGWEHLLGEEPLSEGAARQFAEGRAGIFLAVAECTGRADSAEGVLKAAQRWAIADAAAHASRDDERGMLVRLGLEQGARPAQLPGSMRGLAVLDALARRSLKLGGRPLMEGRGAAICALRAGLLGR